MMQILYVKDLKPYFATKTGRRDQPQDQVVARHDQGAHKFGVHRRLSRLPGVREPKSEAGQFSGTDHKDGGSVKKGRVDFTG